MLVGLEDYVPGDTIDRIWVAWVQKLGTDTRQKIIGVSENPKVH